MSPALGNLSFMETFLEYSKLSNPGSIGILPSELYMVWMSSGLNNITIFPFPIPGTFNLQPMIVIFVSGGRLNDAIFYDCLQLT